MPTATDFTTFFTLHTPPCWAGRQSLAHCFGASAEANRCWMKSRTAAGAAVIEEGVAALAFDYARRHRFLDGVAALDFQLLRTVKDMTSHLEVRQCTTGEWEQAIVQGFAVWRAVVAAGGGRIDVDLDARRIASLAPRPIRLCPLEPFRRVPARSPLPCRPA